MKLEPILSLAAVAVAVATTAVANNSSTNANSTAGSIQGLPLNYTLTPNAVELLQSNNLWAPDLAAFAAGSPNVNDVNFTAEVEKFRESGLDANEVVTVSIDNTAAIAAALGHNEYDLECQQCNSCQVGCIILVIFLPFYGACIGGCMKSGYCNGCGLT